MYSMQRSVSELPLRSVSAQNAYENYTSSCLQKSKSLGNCSVEKKRGFKPSDRHDPVKKEFLINLSKQIWQKESGTKNVDLQKIFTPATDAGEILPKNRKLYASSAFYSPTLHPTVEDQVELARRISHSLSDISNQQSKGQSMYVNRKKRSVKWVHEGEGRAEIQEYNGYSEETKENGYTTKSSSSSVHHDKVPLKLVMNPRGQIRDFRQEDFNTEAGLLSPDKCAELVTALHAPTGKGAELFAKRRKKSEKWIIDESNAATHSPGGGFSYGPLKPTSPIVPAYSDVGVQRVQLNMHQDQVQDKYAQPRLKLVKTPWEAALETGNASSAFQELPSTKGRGFPGSGTTYDYSGQQQTFSTTPSYYQPEPTYEPQPQKTFPKQSYGPPSSQRELAYKPSVPQGWNAPPPMLPSENAPITPPAAASAYASSSAQNDSYYLENKTTASSATIAAAASSTVAINKIESSKSSSSSSTTTTKHIQNDDNHKLDAIRIEENFGQTDEDEIIQFMERTKLQQNNQKYIKHDTLVQQNFINCMAKSPELMVSDAKSNYVRYDNAVKELKTAIIMGQTTDPQSQESFTQVNLRKIDHDPEEHSRLLSKTDDNSENEEEYVKIPVKQLISSFEKRKSPIIRQKSYQKSKDMIETSDQSNRKSSQGSVSEELNYTHGDQEIDDTDQGQALYVPPQIPLDSYVPPATEKYLPQGIRTSSSSYQTSSYQTTSSSSYQQQQPIYQSPSSFPTYQPPPPAVQAQSQSFPVSSSQTKTSAYSYSSAPPKQTTTHWVSHQGPKATGPTTAFDPSPLPYEKLAKFEQPNPDDPYATSYPPPRRLAPPSQSRVRNVSPTPYLSSSLPSKPSYPPPRTGPPPASTLSPPQVQASHQQFPTGASSNYYAPSDDSYSYGSLPSSRVSVDLSQCQNYNTAARGWNQMRDYYRPITFSKPRTELPYTDF